MALFCQVCVARLCHGSPQVNQKTIGNIFPALVRTRIYLGLMQKAYRIFLIPLGFRTGMASFSDCPLEVAAEIIATLDNQDDLKACSLTCRSLLPLCRAFIFGYIEFSIRGHIISFGRLLDSNPSLSDYVRNLVYEIRFQDCDDDNVSRILKQFRRLHSFCLIGDQENHTDWDTLPQPFLDSLLHITLLPSITSLEIFCFKVFPITLFSLCPNLTSLALSDISDDSVVEYKSILNKVPQLSSLELDLRDSKLGKLVGVDQSNGFPVFDIFNLRSLSVFVEEYSDLAAFHALLNATNKLETLEYIGVSHNYSF